MDIKVVFSDASKRYGSALKGNFFLIILLVICKDIQDYLPFPHEKMWQNSLQGLQVLVFLSLFFLSMIVTAHLLAHKKMSYFSECKKIGLLILKAFLALAVFCAFTLCLYFSVRFLGLALYGHAPNKALIRAGLIIFLAGFPVLYLFIRLIFVFPLILAHETPVFQAFLQSYRYVSHHWLYSFTLYILIMSIYLLISPTTLHGHFLASYRLSAPYDFLVLALLWPIMLNVWLLMLSNLQRAYAWQSHQFKRQDA